MASLTYDDFFNEPETRTRRPIEAKCFEIDRLTLAVVAARYVIMEFERNGWGASSSYSVKINRIKFVRDITRWSLREAKEFVEVVFAAGDKLTVDGAVYNLEDFLTPEHLDMLLKYYSS